MRSIQRGITTTFIVIIILAAAVSITAVYFTYTIKQKTSVNSFEDCAKLYPVMESYPEQCNTPDGKHFTREITTVKKVQSIPTVQPSPYVQLDGITNWKTYSNQNLKVEFKYPSEFSYEESDNRNTSSTEIQELVIFKSGKEEFTLERTNSGGVPPYMEAKSTETLNGITWKVSEPGNTAQFCDAGACSGIRSTYYMFKSNFKYSFAYDSKPLIQNILKNFKFLE